MRAEYVEVGDTLIGHLRAIIPDATIDDTEVMLIAFDVYNTGTEQTKWWYDEVEIVTTNGNAFDADGAVYDGFGTAHDDVPDGWEVRPRIEPESARRVLGEVAFPDGQEFDRLRYRYTGDNWTFELDQEQLEELSMSFETFLEEEADHYPDWGELDMDALRAQSEDTSSSNSKATASTKAPVDKNRIPDISFDNVGGLDEQIQELREAVEDPLKRPEVLEEIGIEPPGGVLLHGPPGTGKTMLAKAVANESEASFFRIAGPELAQKYVGEGARIVRETFETARDHQPAIIFIDEIDAIASSRSDDSTGGQEGVYRTMMQLLAEMDGFDPRGHVHVIGATNRLDRLDKAVLRPGRFDRIVEVPEPNQDGRTEIFRQYAAGMNTENVDFVELGQRTDGLTGAHIKSICTEAGYMALRDERTTVRHMDFLAAVQKVVSTTADV